MTDLKVRIFKGQEEHPATTVTIPGSVLKIAINLIPKRAAAALHEEGIDLDELAALSQNPEAQGTLVEVEDHKKNERVVVALE